MEVIRGQAGEDESVGGPQNALESIHIVQHGHQVALIEAALACTWTHTHHEAHSCAPWSRPLLTQLADCLVHPYRVSIEHEESVYMSSMGTGRP